MSDPKIAALKRDPATNGIVLPLVIVYGRDAVAQRLRARFNFFKGEWFLDRRLGVPYYGNILVKNPNMRIVRLIMRKVVLTCPGVQSLLSFNIGPIDVKNRHVDVDFEAKLSDGSTFTSKPGEFIITVP